MPCGACAAFCCGRHAANVQRLSLVLRDVGEHEAEVSQLIAASAVSCGPPLRQLSIWAEGPQQPRLVLSSWLGGLRSLTHLDMRACDLSLAVSLASLTNLGALVLTSQTLVQCPALPPSLTTLAWVCSSSLSKQVTGLQRLRVLSLRQPSIAGSLDVVTRLAPSVVVLDLAAGLTCIPAGLAALVGQLEMLRLSSLSSRVLDAGGLTGLTNLKLLALEGKHGIAPLLDLLSRLQRLLLSNGLTNPKAPPALPPVPAQPVLRGLPPGPWLYGLTHLALSHDVLFASLDVLPGAIHLQSLSAMRLQCMPAAPPPGEPPPRWAALRAWLCIHPPLRRLTLVCWAYVRTELLDLMLALAERRPSLVVERRRTVDGF